MIIDEILKLLLEDRFSRKADSSSSSLVSHPKSSIEENISKVEKSLVSLPQSQILGNTMNYIQDQLRKDQTPEDWVVQKRDQNNLVNMKFCQSHNDKVPSSKEVPLDNVVNKLKLSLSSHTQIPVKNLNTLENQLRNLLKVLSHADIFSYTAYKSLSQEKLNPSVLKRILESFAASITHSVSLVSLLTVEVQQARREATIRSAPKSLSDLAKIQLGSVTIISDTLFGAARSMKFIRKMRKH